MKRGFYTIMLAQFFSSLADNALFVVAVELLRAKNGPEWTRAALVPMFALFYVILAPFVGALADSRPKGQVMFASNAVKVLGCVMMLFGTYPLAAYAVVGLGAAAYSPAKYGLLTELLPTSQQRAIDTLNAWGATALALNASVWASGSTLSNPSGGAKSFGSGELWIRLRGSRAAVSAGVQTVLGHCERGGILVQTKEHDQARVFWSALKNQQHEFFDSTGLSENCLWRLSVPQKTPELIIEGVDPSLPQCLEWNAAQRWLWAPSGLSSRIRGAALKAGGHATLWRVSPARAEVDRGVGVFTPLTQAQQTIQKALQREFDPWGLFDTGRLEI